MASATLYIKNQYGDDKCDYICDILAVPTSRIYLAPPIVAKWVTSMPTLCIPSQTEALLLSRPKLENIAGTDDWLLNLSKRIELIANQAKGGTLVLATSYAQLCAFTTYLSKSSVNQNRLIIQEKYKKVEVNRTLFKQKHAEGIQPVWLALGSAWTGLNLKEDNENIEDTLFTDLVITCCPLNNNRSNTMLARIEARSMNPIIKEALMTLKQGLGRLMRNEKQQGRKIWFLDGRIYHGTWKGMEEMQKSTIKLLLQYKKVIIFNGDSSK